MLQCVGIRMLVEFSKYLERFSTAVLNLWPRPTGGPQPRLRIENFLCESRATIHDKVLSLSSGVRASAIYVNYY